MLICYDYLDEWDNITNYIKEMIFSWTEISTPFLAGGNIGGKN